MGKKINVKMGFFFYKSRKSVTNIKAIFLFDFFFKLIDSYKSHLIGHQCVVYTPFFHQLFVCSIFYNNAFMEAGDFVGIFDRGQSMSYHYSGSTSSGLKIETNQSHSFSIFIQACKLCKFYSPH